jgi:hypothetical protein
MRRVLPGASFNRTAVYSLTKNVMILPDDAIPKPDGIFGNDRYPSVA